MPVFSAYDIVRLWENGCRQHPLDRALTMLARACPEVDRSSLAALTIGQRDALLLELREQVFGGKMEAFAECPQCRERLEFSLETADFLSFPDIDLFEVGKSLRYEEDGLHVTYRLPDSRDLAVAAGCGTPEAARAVLVQRCILESSLDNRQIPPLDLPDAITAEIAARMSETDPVGDIVLNLSCPACHVDWQQPFDIGSFFWTEIAVHAKRLLREVHALARAYGWGEGEILSMSYDRRNNYLEMIEG